MALSALDAQTSGIAITATALGQVYDSTAGSLLVFTGTPGAARAVKRQDPRWMCAAAPAPWLCVSPDGVVSAASSPDSSPVTLDLPAGPDSLAVGASGGAVALWYAGPGRLYVVTGATAPIRMVAPAAPVAEVVAVSDDGAQVLAHGQDGCAWLLGFDSLARCLQHGEGALAAAFGDHQDVLLAYRGSREVYRVGAGADTAQLLAGPRDGIADPAAVLLDGTRAFVADQAAGSVHTFELDTGVRRDLTSPAGPSQFLPLGHGLYLTTPLASGSLILLEAGPAPRLVAAAMENGGVQ
jgi:hypothetical protein